MVNNRIGRVEDTNGPQVSYLTQSFDGVRSFVRSLAQMKTHSHT